MAGAGGQGIGGGDGLTEDPVAGPGMAKPKPYRPPRAARLDHQRAAQVAHIDRGG